MKQAAFKEKKDKLEGKELQPLQVDEKERVLNLEEMHGKQKIILKTE